MSVIFLTFLTFKINKPLIILIFPKNQWNISLVKKPLLPGCTTCGLQITKVPLLSCRIMFVIIMMQTLPLNKTNTTFQILGWQTIFWQKYCASLLYCKSFIDVDSRKKKLPDGNFLKREHYSKKYKKGTSF